MKHLKKYIWFVIPLLIIISCSKEKQFKVSTLEPGYVKACRMLLKGSAKSGSRLSILEKGFCFHKDKLPSIDDNKTLGIVNGDEIFEVEIKDLVPNSTYFIKAFSVLSDGSIMYGNLIQITTNGEYEIGDRGPAGGIVFNTNSSSSANWRFAEEYLVPNTYVWGCEGLDIPLADISNEWFAIDNSNEIVKICKSQNTAAAICINGLFNGYNDWFLPTAAELSRIYSLNTLDLLDYPEENYWSSTQYDNYQGYFVSFSDGVYRHSMKSVAYRIIAVRYFN